MTEEEYKYHCYLNNLLNLAEQSKSAYLWAKNGENRDNAVKSIEKVLDICQNEVFLEQMKELMEILNEKEKNNL